MERLKELLQPCDENTLRGILVELCTMFQRDYLNVPKLHEGKLKGRHFKEIVGKHKRLAEQRLAGGVRGEDSEKTHDVIFVGPVPCPTFLNLSARTR